MPPRRAAPLLAAVVTALLALPAVAGAATLAPLKGCYVSNRPMEREAVDLTGGGFAPRALVDISLDGRVERRVQADAAGNLPPTTLAAPYQKRGERPFTVTATDRANPANTTTIGSRVTALDVRLHPARARPSRRVRFRGRGFTRDRPIYGHYLYRGHLRKTVRLMRRPGSPCGRLRARRRQIPIRRPRLGKWTLQVDQQRAYEPSPPGVNVRVPITVQRVFRLRSR